MSKFDELLSTVEVDQERLEESKMALNRFLIPIIEALGVGMRGNYVDDVMVDGDCVQVTYVWSCRGCPGSDYVSVPRFVLESEDPVRTAREHKALEDERKAAREKEAKREQVRKLLKELDD